MKSKRRWIRFFIIVGLLHGIFLLAGTESGLGLVFTGLVRLNAEAYSPQQSANAVYYDMRLPVSEAKYIVVALDFSVNESCDAFLHFFRFIKQYQMIDVVFLANDDFASYAQQLGTYVTEQNTDALQLPSVLSSYAEGLRAIEDTMQPSRKFSVTAIAEADWKTSLVSDNENAVLLLCDRDIVMQSENRTFLMENDVFLWEIKYDRCMSDSGMRTDISLPFTGEETGYYMMSMERISAFCRYYKYAVNLFGLDSMMERSEKLESENAAYFCVITNAVSNNAEETPTVSDEMR